MLLNSSSWQEGCNNIMLLYIYLLTKYDEPNLNINFVHWNFIIIIKMSYQNKPLSYNHSITYTIPEPEAWYTVLFIIEPEVCGPISADPFIWGSVKRPTINLEWSFKVPGWELDAAKQPKVSKYADELASLGIYCL